MEQAFALREKNRTEKFNLVVEALKERSYMIQNAQYMNKKLPILVPSSSIFEAIYFYIGSVVYHSIYYIFDDNANKISFDFPYLLWGDEVRAKFPHLSKNLKYGVVYYDGQMNDSRMDIDILLTSTIQGYNKKNLTGANVVNYMNFESFIKDDKGKIIGGRVYDKINDKYIDVKAHAVVNCTGVFADEIRQKDNPNAEPRIIPCAGSHLIMPGRLCNKKMGLVIPKTDDGRVMFLIPWLNNTLAGTTDNEVKKPEMDPTVPVNDIIFMIKELSRLYPEYDTAELTRQIKSKWCGK